MTILPLDPVANATPEALRAFLGECRDAAARDGHAKLVSISIAVDALDPLAVLESIFEPGEPHFYAERVSLDVAIAGAEAVVGIEASGAQRFAEVQRFIDTTLAHTIAVGETEAAFGGPHFFAAFAFEPELPASEPFPAARVFVPRWQVARAGERTTAVANLLVAPDTPLDLLTEKVWRAHAKFRRFDYGRVEAGGPAGESSTGILPVESGAAILPGKSSTGILPVAPLSGSGELHIRRGAHLPHSTRSDAVYAVTFRLADSLPESALEEWRLERARLTQTAREQERPLSEHEEQQLARLHSKRVEAFLDAGAGACFLKRPEVAESVAHALRHLDGVRYRLHAWCVMPNHVHVVVQPLGGHPLSEIVHSWKSYTANEANRVLNRHGEFWQVEYYDHLIRDEADYARVIQYVRRNPEKAGLSGWRWQGSGTAGLHGQDARATANTHGQDARATAALRVADHGDYPAAVAQALARIAAGEFNKIVLARTRSVEATQPLHPLEMLNQLRQRFPECYAFSIANGRGQSFIGATPERLARVSRGVLETEALAGSAPRGASASEDARHGAALLQSEKERREQRLVLESIQRRLESLGLSLTFPPEPVLRRLANVQHLLTPIRAVLPASVGLLDVVARLHPTPAVGGSPRAAAVAALRELEGFSRGLYAGAIGWINARGGGEFFVGLRSALVDGRTARLFAGAGIVAGSSPERELAETELKFRAMQEALKL